MSGSSCSRCPKFLDQENDCSPCESYEEYKRLMTGRVALHKEEQAEEKEEPKGILSQVWKTIHAVIMSTPKSLGEALWRTAAVTSVSSLLVSGWIVWRYPDLLHNILEGDNSAEIQEIFRRKPAVRERSMALIASFMTEYKPTQFALVSWETATGINRAWANESTSNWPTSTDGVLSTNLAPAMGDLVFGRCWVGQLSHPSSYGDIHSGEEWAICPLADQNDIWGMTIAHWHGTDKGAPADAVTELGVMNRRLQQIIFF